MLKPILKGEDVKRYAKSEFQFYCVYPYKLVDGKTVILQEKEFENLFPNCFSYLKKYKIELRNLRVKYKTNPRYWYSCHRGRVINDFETDKIISQEISDYPSMTIELNKLYHNTTVYSLIPNQNITESIYYWLGILNSNLFWYYLKNTGNVLRGGYFRFKTNYLKPFPLKAIKFESIEKETHDQITEKVKNIISNKENLSNAKTPQEKTALQRQIDVTDKQIDQLVYQLYGLTEEEIKLVEEE